MFHINFKHISYTKIKLNLYLVPVHTKSKIVTGNNVKVFALKHVLFSKKYGHKKLFLKENLVVRGNTNCAFLFDVFSL